jgi:hypothetical protein
MKILLAGATGYAGRRLKIRLLLEAQMKVFGKAWLEFRIEEDTLIQIAHHCPRGILGRLYWHCMLPFHFVIFRDMIRSIIKQAREME